MTITIMILITVVIIGIMIIINESIDISIFTWFFVQIYIGNYFFFSNSTLYNNIKEKPGLVLIADSDTNMQLKLYPKFLIILNPHCTKNNFSNKDFFSKCGHIRRKLRIWSHLLKKSLMENFIFYAVPFNSNCPLL